jgi:hypothetical protein
MGRGAQAIVDGLGGVLFQYPFRVPAYYALILRSLTVLEGLALQANPRYKLLGKAYPYMARRLLTDPAPELRCARAAGPGLRDTCSAAGWEAESADATGRSSGLYVCYCIVTAWSPVLSGWERPPRRSSFEELVLDAGGRLRWARLDNLLAESRKSQGFDPAQLWLLADWLLTEAAPPLRRTLADEAARLLDAAVAGAPVQQDLA